MIQAESDNVKRDEYLKRLMSLPNQVCSRLWHVLLLSVYIYIYFKYKGHLQNQSTFIV
jgi:hypothetical protein